MRRLIAIVSLLMLIVLFQNCSGQFSKKPIGLASTEATNETPLPTPSPAPAPAPTPSPAPVVINTASLFVTLPPIGVASVTLHPSSQAVAAGDSVVIFAMPFPKGVVSDLNFIRVLDGNNVEIPSQVSAQNFWRDFQNPTQIVSLRSVRIVIRRTFANTNPQSIQVQYGAQRTQNLVGVFDLATTWQSISLGPNPTEYPAAANVREPLVYATLSPDWISACLLQSRTAAVNSVASTTAFDTAFLRHTNTATTGTTYQTGFEPWLYDRAQTLFIAYFRTGDITRLRAAHRAAQFYKANITAGGAFALGGDAKYVYGQSMLYDYMLTADATLLPVIERATMAHSGWPTNVSLNTNFWTERNSAYALQSVLAAFDATGSASYAARARALFQSYFSLQQQPLNNWVKNGCSMHTNTQHDPSETIPAVMCSPWMGALLSEAIWKYYLLSMDQNALIYLADFADYIQMHALYTLGAFRLPYYGATSYGRTDPDGDQEHTCDVMGALVRGAWAKKALGRDTSNLTADRNALISACQSNVTGSGLSPLRKYSWWFGTTSDFSWFLSTL